MANDALRIAMENIYDENVAYEELTQKEKDGKKKGFIKALNNLSKDANIAPWFMPVVGILNKVIGAPVDLTTVDSQILKLSETGNAGDEYWKTLNNKQKNVFWKININAILETVK